MTPAPARIGILVASDRAHAGPHRDGSGPAIETYLGEVLASDYRHVPNEIETSAETLIEFVGTAPCDLVLISGGTGTAPCDEKPKAMARFVGRLLPGSGEEMRRARFREVPTAILSLQEVGWRERCLINALPVKPSAIATCLDAIFAPFPIAST